MWEDRNDQWTQYQVRVLPAYWNISDKPFWNDIFEPNSESYTSCFLCTDSSSPYYRITHAYNESYSDIDWFRFFAVEGTNYELTLTDELGGDFYFNLYDSDFNAISTNHSTALTWTCPSTGIYHVRIWERDTNQKGRYYFNISNVSGNHLGLDSDADGMKDCWEIYYFGNGNIYRDGTGDWDGDQLTDKEEHDNGTNPKKIDTDNDGMPDGWEVHNGLNPLIDDTQEDPDNDKLTNIEEYNNQTLPQDPDTDQDGMPDGWEVHNQLNPLINDSAQDYDSDGLTNVQEYINNTNPHDGDTDDDFMPDGWEVTYSLNPLEDDAFSDKDNDGFCNWREYVGNSLPNDKNSIPPRLSLYVDLNSASEIENGTTSHPFKSIQKGVDFAGPGDDVLVSSARYLENITISKSIALVGETPENTFIDGEQADKPSVTVNGTTGARIGGFHITHGTCGVRIISADVEVFHNIVSNTVSGSGIEATADSAVTIANNIFYENSGHGIQLLSASSADVVNNTIVFNNQSGISIETNGNATIKNNILLGNQRYGISCTGSGTSEIAYNVLWYNYLGNYNNCDSSHDDIISEPRFVDPANHDYHLLSGSPCIDSGDSSNTPELDFDGNCRYDDPETEPNIGVGSISYMDIGAYEYFPVCYGDFAEDLDVDGADLAIFSEDFGRTDCGSYPPCEGDLDRDGDVDLNDLKAFVNSFGRTRCPSCR